MALIPESDETRRNGAPPGSPNAAEPNAPPPPTATTEAKWLRIFLIAGAILFAVEAAIYVPEVFTGPAETRPFAINSVAKDVLFAALTAIAAVDLARFCRLVGLVIAGHVVIVALLAAALISGNSASTFPPPRWLADLLSFTDIDPDWRLGIWIAAAAVATVFLIWLYRRMLKVRYDLRYLWPTEHETLAAVADAIIDEPSVPPREVATAVDHYWAGLEIGYKTRLRGALWITCLIPLGYLKLPLPLMERSGRRAFLRDRLLPDIARRDLGWFRGTAQSCVRFAMQMVYMGYYNDRRSHAETGYTRFSERPDYPGDPKPRRALRTRSPEDLRSGDEADVVIIGSGAGGGIAAHALVHKGRSVLVLERGRHVENEEFTDDEALMYERLYSDGAVQTSRNFTFQVLQGMCVGGTTVVNNGICFDIPDQVRRMWNSDHGAGLPDLTDHFDRVRDLIGVTPMAGKPNPVVGRITSGQGAAGGGGVATQLEPVDANIAHDCHGCGYCNIGCRFGKKLSMLDKVLPETQRWADRKREQDPEFKGRLEIVPRCTVTKILKQGSRATGVCCRVKLPDGGERKVRITAGTVVVAAGAVHSSRLLMGSGIGGELVGQGLCANLGSHITGYFDKGAPLRAFEGVQMSHYRPKDEESDHLIETWFNPLMSQALVMPGWLDDHQRNMRRYTRLGVLGVLVGSERRNSNHVMRRRAFFSGSEIDFTPSEVDLRRLLQGLRDAGQILLDAGARCVMPMTFGYRELTKENLGDLRLGGLVKDASDISVNTGHPQGGNAMSTDPARGVVNGDLQVHGFDNLYVCDASVFPTAVNVNPQLTVMALAHRAAPGFVEDA